MSFIRTILGDVPSGGLGACGAHEHIIIDSPHIAARFPEFVLDDVAAACVDLAEFRAAGGGWLVDTMPGGAGRSPARLADASRRGGVHIVCPTGLHLPRYYPPGHPLLAMEREPLGELFEREILRGFDEVAGDQGGPIPGRAGVIKVAGDRDRLTPHQREAFRAAAEVSRRTGCPIITHTEQGTAAEEQIRLLLDGGANAAHVILSHTGRIPDIGYHRALLSTGVTLEYDNHFRTELKQGICPTADLIAALAPEFPGQIVVGMDIARRASWHGHGGQPGLAWMLTDLPELLKQRGVPAELIEGILIRNPARAFSFAAASI